VTDDRRTAGAPLRMPLTHTSCRFPCRAESSPALDIHYKACGLLNSKSEKVGTVSVRAQSR